MIWPINTQPTNSTMVRINPHAEVDAERRAAAMPYGPDCYRAVSVDGGVMLTILGPRWSDGLTRSARLELRLTDGRSVIIHHGGGYVHRTPEGYRIPAPLKQWLDCKIAEIVAMG